MNLVTLDYETYYDKEYSLSRMPTEDYVNDPQFELMMVGLKIDAAPAIAHVGDMKSTREFLYDHKVDRSALLCQNTMFDQLINQVYFDINPPVLLDTMCMAQALLKPYLRRVSLASILEYLSAGMVDKRAKGQYVLNMRGRHLASLTPTELANYKEYNLDDVENCYWAFQQFLQMGFPREELDVIDMTLRMYFDTKLELDTGLLRDIYDKTIADKDAMMAKLPKTIQRADLMSNIKMADLLRSLSIEPPMKISPATGKPTYAFAKNDPAWLDMVEEYGDDPVVAPILAARQSEKSTIVETRAKRLLDIAQRYAHFRVPLRYYAAHTGRYGGAQSINTQNFNRVDQKKKLPSGLLDRRQVRFAIRAPMGSVVVAGDQAQIEARLNAWESGCKPLVSAFAQKKDIYSEFASSLFHKPVRKNDPATEKERFVGKTCILGLGYGMGGPKLRATLRKDKIKLDILTADSYVHFYRNTYPEIPRLWNYCDSVIEVMAAGGAQRIGPCVARGNVIELPNGMELVYNNLRWVEAEAYAGWLFDWGGRSKTLWGGKLVENITQALARIIITNAMRAIRKELKQLCSMQAHDELVYVVPETYAPLFCQEASAIMKRRPSWAPDLPIDVEMKFGPTYGDAK